MKHLSANLQAYFGSCWSGLLRQGKGEVKVLRDLPVLQLPCSVSVSRLTALS